MKRSHTHAIGRWAIGYFALSTVALVAPVYTWLGNHIEPRLLGLPWSLVYVLVIVVANSAVLGLLYARRWVDDVEAEPSVDRPGG